MSFAAKPLAIPPVMLLPLTSVYNLLPYLPYVSLLTAKLFSLIWTSLSLSLMKKPAFIQVGRKLCPTSFKPYLTIILGMLLLYLPKRSPLLANGYIKSNIELMAR